MCSGKLCLFISVGALCSSENDHYHAVEGLKLFTFILSSPPLTPGGAGPSFSSSCLQRQLSLVILLCRARAFLRVNQNIIHFLLCVCYLYQTDICGCKQDCSAECKVLLSSSGGSLAQSSQKLTCIWVFFGIV